MAYTNALVQRLFEDASRRSANFTLKITHVFAVAFASLNGGLNDEQRKVLKDIPNDVRTLESRLDLGINTVPYAVCPECAYTHQPTYPNGPTRPTYPSTCIYKVAPIALPCGTALLKDGKPIKIFEYYPFFDWFARFISLPGIRGYGDAFCEAVSRQPDAPSEKGETCDGRIYRELKDVEGRLFLADRGKEGRWLFLLQGDFFNVETNKIGGKHTSTGVMSMTCLNLPITIRDDQAYVYIPGIIQGPHEPSAVEAQHQHYLRPLVDDLVAGYARGVQCFSGPVLTGSERTERVALAGLVMDFKAARPFAGLMDVNSHTFCFSCKLWHTSQAWRTDFEEWEKADDEYLRKGAEMWRDTLGRERKAIEELYGTRYSAFWRLPYFRPSLQMLVDPMHTVFLILQQRLFRFILHMAENEVDGMDTEINQPGALAYYYPFTPPPSLSSIGVRDDDEPYKSEDEPSEADDEPSEADDEPSEADDEPSDTNNKPSETNDAPWPILKWRHLSHNEQALREARRSDLQKTLSSGNSPGLKGVSAIHRRLSRARPGTDSAGQDLKRSLGSRKWTELAYVCNDVLAFPADKADALASQEKLSKQDMQKTEMEDALLHWVSVLFRYGSTMTDGFPAQRVEQVVEDGPFEWPYFTPRGTEPPDSQVEGETLLPDQPAEYRQVSPEECQRELEILVGKMNYNGAAGVGHIHRYLCEPMHSDDIPHENGALTGKLMRQPLTSVKYVCVDINRLPRVGAATKVTKAALVRQLLQWVRTSLTVQSPVNA